MNNVEHRESIENHFRGSRKMVGVVIFSLPCDFLFEGFFFSAFAFSFGGGQ